MRCHRVLAAAAAACAAAIAVASPAAAATYDLSGTQVGTNTEWALNYGGLLGAWDYVQVTLDPASVPPIFHFTGTEKFYGCLNLNHDGYCYKEPSGTLSFNHETWIKSFPPYNEDSEVWGACYHPITGGTGDFKGADGVLTMVDTQTSHGIHTRWQAILILPDAAQASARAHRTRPRQLLRRLMRTHSTRTAAVPRGTCGAGT